MNISKWLKRKAAIIGLALSNVEKNVLSQRNSELSNNPRTERRITQHSLLDALLRGEITQEVKELRWRMYKAFKASKEYSLTTNKETRKVSKVNLSSIKVDNVDTYPVELVVFNNDITTDILDVIEQTNIDSSEKVIKNVDESGNTISATHGTISGIEYFTHNKGEKPIGIHRDNLAKFEIEKYTKKLVVRQIDEKHKLLEFYISMYPDEDNRITRLLISDIKKAMINPRSANMLDISEVGFITDNCLGVPDYLEYQYKILGFDKIIEFDGNYVIKFKSEVIVNGVDIIEQYKEAELDEKYKNKAKRKLKQ